MKKVYFLFCIHNHQPVGNLDHVFKKAFSQAYTPLIDQLERHPSIRVCLHYSGTLLEWMVRHAPELLERLRCLIERNQVEILSGGFYEPIFSSLRETDTIGQISMMQDFLQNNLGCSPKGIWLAERVWDPVLPRVISNAGLSYTLLDSTHFLHAGMPPEQIHGYYMTERDGHPLAIFPINRQMRYSIPFKPPKETIDYLRYMASDEQSIAVTYGDDGEKFGLWPGTAKWVYEDGWLEQFFNALEDNSDMIRMCTFSGYLAEAAATGSIYLPSLSYDELMEWALPTDAVIRFEDMLHELEDNSIKEKYSSFIHGGCWNNFLVKYPEANHMHKKMLQVSERLERVPGDAASGLQEHRERARRELYQAQCNCAYWHGMFGGVYLNYLRHAVYEHLINAEKILDGLETPAAPGPRCTPIDFRRDKTSVLQYDSDTLGALFDPAGGGALLELDLKPRAFNLTNTISRRMESYHRFLKRDNGNGGRKPFQGQPITTQMISRGNEQELQPKIAYDWYRRNSFMDHFLGPEATLEGFAQSRYPELGNFLQAPYRVAQVETDPETLVTAVQLQREGFILQHDKEQPVRVTKRFLLNPRQMTLGAGYSIQNNAAQDLDLWFGSELNLTLLAGDDPLRYYRFPGFPDHELPMNTKASFGSIEAFSMMDEWSGFELTLTANPAAGVWVLPLETVARSENGLECSYQSSTLLLHRKMRVAPGQTHEFTILLGIALFIGEKEKI